MAEHPDHSTAAARERLDPLVPRRDRIEATQPPLVPRRDRIEATQPPLVPRSETWHATGQDFPRDRLVHQCVTACAAATPEAVALTMGDQVLTYRELESRANQLAHHLRTLGVGPEMLVGVCMERSPAFVVAALGILKAGGA